MLDVRNLNKSFQSGGSTVHAVVDVTFTVPTGMFASVVGPSGSGKSTLLSLLGALDKPTSGSIEVDGETITNGNDRQLIKYRRNMIGFTFQSFNLVPNLDAIGNVMLPMEFAGIKRPQRIERAKALLDQVRLTGAKQTRRPGKLSGGEQRARCNRSRSGEPTAAHPRRRAHRQPRLEDRACHRRLVA